MLSELDAHFKNKGRLTYASVLHALLMFLDHPPNARHRKREQGERLSNEIPRPSNRYPRARGAVF